MKFRRASRRRGKMLISPTAFAALCCQKSLTGFGKIKKQISRFGVKNLRSNRNFDGYVLTIFAVTIRAFTVATAFGAVFGIVAQMQECIVTFVRFKPNVAATPAVAARR